MAHDNFSRRISRIVEVVDAIGHEVRATAILRILQNPDGIRAGKAFPEGLSAAGRAPHIKRLRLFFAVDRPSKKEDSVYSLPERLQLPLREAIEALERLAAAVKTKRFQQPQIVVALGRDGVFVVEGESVDDCELPDKVRALLEAMPVKKSDIE